MDIIDIMLARAMTPQGKTEAYVTKANKAARDAAKAKEDAETAAATLTSAAEDLAAAQELLETLQQMEINTLDTEDVDAEVKKLTVNANIVDSAGAKTIQMITTYPDNTLNTQNLTKLYKATGQNEDGTMTQKAITDALGAKADTSALAGKMDAFNLNDYASKQYVNSAISNIPTSSGGTINFSTDDEGHILVVDENGHAVASTIKENDLLGILVQSDSFEATGAVGIEIDYENKSITRIQEAQNKQMGSDFNGYTMYGGRMRCNVAADGTINAFYGDPTYTDDGSNGNVMVYQPKFYYERTPIKTEPSANGTIIRKEMILISAEAQPGFKLHPLFIDDDDNELDYILLSAYEGSLDNDKLVSIAGKKPISNITLDEAEAYANANGSNWHLTNMEFESAMQMLEMIEFGMMNGQNALEKGLSTIPSISDFNCAANTGSTTSLGNGIGYATSTTVEVNGTSTTYNENGRRAISYRGVENPWGNIWRMIGGAKVVGVNENNGGQLYICSTSNYANESAYVATELKLPPSSGWISAMGYNKNIDWIYLPIECSNANSALPVGDNIWAAPYLNTTNVIIVGGKWSTEDSNGPFCYGSDRTLANSAQRSYGARLMYKPDKTSNAYNTNLVKWATKMEG